MMQAHYADSFIEVDYSRIQQTCRWINVSLSNEAAEELVATLTRRATVSSVGGIKIKSFSHKKKAKEQNH